MNYTQQAKINKAMNEYNLLMGISSNEMKELNQKLLENMMKGINLRIMMLMLTIVVRLI